MKSTLPHRPSNTKKSNSQRNLAGSKSGTQLCKPKTQSLEASPVSATTKLAKTFSAAVLLAQPSKVCTKAATILRAHMLPPTDLPAPVKLHTIKKRFRHMSETLERIPSADWLGSVLFAPPEFTQALAHNLSKCKEKLSKLQLVREAIREEDGDCSEWTSRESSGTASKSAAGVSCE